MHNSGIAFNFVVQIPGLAIDHVFDIPKSSSTGTGELFSAAIKIRILG